MRRYDSKQLSENACVSCDLIPPLASAHAHTHTHPLTPPLAYPGESLWRGRVHSLPVPLSVPHPVRNQKVHTFLCVKPPPPCCIPPQQEFTCVGLRLGGQAPPSTISSLALGSGTEQNAACRLWGREKKKKPLVTLVFTTRFADANGHIFYVPNTWYGFYDCYMPVLSLFRRESRLCCRLRRRQSEDSKAEWGRCQQWPWHLILALANINCVSTAFYKVVLKS